MEYLSDLNDKQKEAVLYTEGPLLIVAGAGAGKTKTITHRIIHLIHKGIAPENILAVTFTNKAAKEMRDRVMHMLPQGIEEMPFLSTFHSLGVYIIKNNAHLIGLNKYFNIADDADSISIIKRVMKSLDIDPKQYEPRKIKSVISRTKGDFIDVDNFVINQKSALESITGMVWRGYEKILKDEKSLDFDDLLIKAVLILKKYPEVKDKYQEQFKYIHIDEYQDTNEVQYEMTKLLVGEKKNICVVGDTDQNIYSWRGANIKNMLHFEKDYPDTKIIMLEQNYRSTKNILETANEIIKKNIFRVPKNLFTENSQGEKLSVFEAYDEVQEANFVAEKIDELMRNNDPEEIAILYRANFQSRILEEAMLSRQIPYQVLGTKFFERKEIKDVLSYIKASLNPESLNDIKRIINFPARGVGKVTLVKLFSGQIETLPENTRIKVEKFFGLLLDIKNYIETHKPSETIKYIIEKSGIEEELKNETGDDLEKLENIRELVTLATKYDDRGDGIEKLVEDAMLASDQDTLLHKGKGVRMMTVHSAKGLEFKYVFITGLEQDLFPHSGIDRKTKEDKEEERRLFYVAITRAREKLFLSYAVLRTIFGNKQINSPSEFIDDIPKHLVEYEEGNNLGEKIVYI